MGMPAAAAFSKTRRLALGGWRQWGYGLRNVLSEHIRQPPAQIFGVQPIAPLIDRLEQKM